MKKVGIKINLVAGGNEEIDPLVNIRVHGKNLVVTNPSNSYEYKIDEIVNMEVYFVKQELKPARKFKDILREQIVLPEDEKDEDDGFDMYNLNVEEWPEEDGESIDMENWSIVSIDEDGMVMIAGGDWQEGAVMRIGVNDEGDGLKVLELYEYDEEKHGERLEREAFYKELMK